jgi:hypothetical protein
MIPLHTDLYGYTDGVVHCTLWEYGGEIICISSNIYLVGAGGPGMNWSFGYPATVYGWPTGTLT